MLRIENLHVHYGGIHALKGISIEVNEGEIVTLIGANGAGKSTTLRTISGLVKPSGGDIFYNGESIVKYKPYKIVAAGISQVPEGRRIFPNLTVEDNLDLGAYARRDGSGVAADKEEIFRLFPRLKERRKQLGGTLSGGEQQMLAIGRALMARPKLMLMDEPSMGLAPLLVREIFEIIQRINREGTTILLVEQNAHMALSIAHRAYVLETGSITLAGTPRELMEDENVKKAYLGE
ncbi:MAG: ABC transporter ATP-binding protein [bacterium]